MSKTFKIGDSARSKYDGTIRTVSWVSKCGELIATEYNGYCNPHSPASCYSRIAES